MSKTELPLQVFLAGILRCQSLFVHIVFAIGMAPPRSTRCFLYLPQSITGPPSTSSSRKLGATLNLDLIAGEFPFVSNTTPRVLGPSLPFASLCHRDAAAAHLLLTAAPVNFRLPRASCGDPLVIIVALLPSIFFGCHRSTETAATRELPAANVTTADESSPPLPRHHYPENRCVLGNPFLPSTEPASPLFAIATSALPPTIFLSSSFSISLYHFTLHLTRHLNPAANVSSVWHFSQKS